MESPIPEEQEQTTVAETEEFEDEVTQKLELVDDLPDGPAEHDEVITTHRQVITTTTTTTTTIEEAGTETLTVVESNEEGDQGEEEDAVEENEGLENSNEEEVEEEEAENENEVQDEETRNEVEPREENGPTNNAEEKSKATTQVPIASRKGDQPDGTGKKVSEMIGRFTQATKSAPVEHVDRIAAKAECEELAGSANNRVEKLLKKFSKSSC